MTAIMHSPEKIALDYEEPSALDGARLIASHYVYEEYKGSSFALFERDGSLWVVEGGHCSCHGLEGQWNPMRVTREYLKQRLERGIFNAPTEVVDAVRATAMAS